MSTTLFRSFFFLSSLSLFLGSAGATPTTHYHNFIVQETVVKRLCHSQQIITVNGTLPGPTLRVRDGDSLAITVVNNASRNISIHWHGVQQLRTAWADGPEFVTQCPMRPGGNYTYRFAIEGKQGTLWWHAHNSLLRATVYGAIVIYPALGESFPFQQPDRDFPVILGEWWNKDPIKVAEEALLTGGGPDDSDAFTINGQPGDLYDCSSEETAIFPVAVGETVLLRVINAAVQRDLFFSVAGHNMMVVGADAFYTKNFSTDFLMLGPGETTDVLITANQTLGRYYLAARVYNSARGIALDNTTATAILQYDGNCRSCLSNSSSTPSAPPQPPTPSLPPQPPPLFPVLPDFDDTGAVTAYLANIKSPTNVTVPEPVDVKLLLTVGVGLLNCWPGKSCDGPFNARLAASINNISFALPTTSSILQADRQQIAGVFYNDFPSLPPTQFDYTGQNISPQLWYPQRGTKVYRLKYGETLQLVFQGTSILTPSSHPMHIHGYDFYVLAVGFGNFNETSDTDSFNLSDPPRRNTVSVPPAGWVAIRFVADNPGAWLLHCHIDMHLIWGLAMVFIVEDGDVESQKLEPPPADLPAC